MKKQITKNDILSDFHNVVLNFENYFETQFNIYGDFARRISTEVEDDKKTDLISKSEDILKRLALIVRWIKQWLAYIRFEKEFAPSILKRYKYGEIIYVNLGFNIGNEFGGPHYALVLNKNDSIKKGVITIVPLSSLKNKDKNKLGDRLYLGDILKKTIQDKLSNNIDELQSQLNSFGEELRNKTINKEAAFSKLKNYQKKAEHNKIVKEHLNKMNNETIALTNQIMTISKMKILNPKTPNDSLSNIVVPKSIMNTIMEKIHNLYG